MLLFDSENYPPLTTGRWSEFISTAVPCPIFAVFLEDPQRRPTRLQRTQLRKYRLDPKNIFNVRALRENVGRVFSLRRSRTKTFSPPERSIAAVDSGSGLRYRNIHNSRIDG